MWLFPDLPFHPLIYFSVFVFGALWVYSTIWNQVLWDFQHCVCSECFAYLESFVLSHKFQDWFPVSVENVIGVLTVLAWTVWIVLGSISIFIILTLPTSVCMCVCVSIFSLFHCSSLSPCWLVKVLGTWLFWDCGEWVCYPNFSLSMSVIGMWDIYWFFGLTWYMGGVSIWATSNPHLLLHVCFIFLFVWRGLFINPRRAQNVLMYPRLA